MPTPPVRLTPQPPAWLVKARENFYYAVETVLAVCLLMAAGALLFICLSALFS